MNWAEEYRKSLKMKEVEEVLDLVIYRPAAFLFVRAVYRTGITPNQISLTAILMGFIAGYFYSLGEPAYFRAGALFFLLFNILDCSDGQLARLKKNGTPVGRIIDGISDLLAILSVFIGITVGFALPSDRPAYWTSMLVLAGTSVIVQSTLVDYYRSRFLDIMKGGNIMSDESLEEFRKEYGLLKGKKGQFLSRIILLIYLKYMALQGLLVAKKKKRSIIVARPEEYYRKNRYLIRLWLATGPTMHVTTIIVCSFFNRFDIFIWIIVAGFNAIALIALILQKIADRSFKHTEQ